MGYLRGQSRLRAAFLFAIGKFLNYYFATFRRFTQLNVLIVVLLLASSVVLSASPQGVTELPTVAEYRMALAGKKWLRTSSVDKTTGEKSVTFTIFAAGFPVDSKIKLPSATVLCGGGLGMYPVIQTGPLNDGSVRLTLDDGTVLKQVWRPRSNHWVGSESDQ